MNEDPTACISMLNSYKLQIENEVKLNSENIGKLQKRKDSLELSLQEIQRQLKEVQNEIQIQTSEGKTSEYKYKNVS